MFGVGKIGALGVASSSGGSTTRTGAFDAMQALQAAYAGFGVRQLVLSTTYTGYAYRAQRSSDSATLDCLPNTTSLALAAWGQAAGAAVIYLTILYDQFGSGLDSDTLTATATGTAPTIDCSVSVYPVIVFNGTSNRIQWSNSTMRNINTTALGITQAAAIQATGTVAATSYFQMISQASGNTTRTSLDFLTTPSFSTRTTRVDGGSATSANTPTSWDLNPHILIGVTNYTAGTVNRYVDGTVGTQATFTALPSPAYVQSGGVFIGGNNTTTFMKMRWTCSTFYNVAISGSNLTALESAMEAAA